MIVVGEEHWRLQVAKCVCVVVNVFFETSDNCLLRMFMFMVSGASAIVAQSTVWSQRNRNESAPYRNEKRSQSFNPRHG